MAITVRPKIDLIIGVALAVAFTTGCDVFVIDPLYELCTSNQQYATAARQTQTSHIAQVEMKALSL